MLYIFVNDPLFNNSEEIRPLSFISGSHLTCRRIILCYENNDRKRKINHKQTEINFCFSPNMSLTRKERDTTPKNSCCVLLH